MQTLTFSPIRRSACLATLLVCLMAIQPAQAWDEDGHSIVAHLAIEQLPPNMPDWLRSPEFRTRLIYLSSEPDRWRGQHHDQLDHLNIPDHYFDVEQLEINGLSLKTLPPYRREFLDLLATRRALKPELFPPYDRAKDAAYTRLSPGMLPYRIAELQWQVASSWTTLKTYEQNRELVTYDLIRNARENVVFHMGLISHFVGDGAQPLHVTDHHNGWQGPNPQGYTTSRRFHQLIDGGLLSQFEITPASLGARALPPKKISGKDYWPQICAYVDASHEFVEPLYALEKSGDLYKPPGKRFLEERLLDGGSMLAGIWTAAYEAAVIDDFRVGQLKAKQGRRATTRPTSQPSSRPAEAGAVPVGAE